MSISDGDRNARRRAGVPAILLLTVCAFSASAGGGMSRGLARLAAPDVRPFTALAASVLAAGLVAGGLRLAGARRRAQYVALGACMLILWPAAWSELGRLYRSDRVRVEEAALLACSLPAPRPVDRLRRDGWAPGWPAHGAAVLDHSGPVEWRSVRCGDVWRNSLVAQPPAGLRLSVSGDGARGIELHAALPEQIRLARAVPVCVACIARDAAGDAVGRAQVTLDPRRSGHKNAWQPIGLTVADTAPAAATLDIVATPVGDVPRTASVPLVALAPAFLRPGDGGRAGGPSCLFVLVDALRADRLHCYGFPPGTSPRIDAFAAEGTLFERVVSACSWTVPSVVSLFTGLNVATHGTADYNPPARIDQPVLAQLFGEVRCRTGAVSADYLVEPHAGFGREFDVFVQSESVSMPRAEWVTDRAIDLLRRWRDERFFLYLHYMDPHAPYEPPDDWARFGWSREGRYLGEILYCDSQVGRLLDALDDLGRRRDTLVVFIADHGEGLGERGYSGHGLSLHREEVRVPLILRFPGRAPAGRRVAAQVRSIDVQATVADLMGLHAPRSVEGESLRPFLGDRPDTADRPAHAALFGHSRHKRSRPFVSLTGSRYKLIVSLRDQKRRLYDLEHDRHERTDCIDREPDVGAAMSREIAQFLTERNRPETRPAAALSEEARRRLHALGYLAPGSE